MTTAIERWATQHAEWVAIGNELALARPGQPVTAYQVSLEQRKRMLARGERPITHEEIIAEHEALEQGALVDFVETSADAADSGWGWKQEWLADGQPAPSAAHYFADIRDLKTACGKLLSVQTMWSPGDCPQCEECLAVRTRAEAERRDG